MAFGEGAPAEIDGPTARPTLDVGAGEIEAGGARGGLAVQGPRRRWRIAGDEVEHLAWLVWALDADVDVAVSGWLSPSIAAFKRPSSPAGIQYSTDVGSLRALNPAPRELWRAELMVVSRPSRVRCAAAAAAVITPSENVVFPGRGHLLGASTVYYGSGLIKLIRQRLDRRRTVPLPRGWRCR